MMNKGLALEGSNLLCVATSIAADHSGADLIDQIKAGNVSIPAMVFFVVLGMFTLYIAYRIGRFILKIFCILIGLAAIVAAISWFVLRN